MIFSTLWTILVVGGLFQGDGLAAAALGVEAQLALAGSGGGGTYGRRGGERHGGLRERVEAAG